MPNRIAEHIPLNILIGVTGAASGFLLDHAGQLASLATGAYMIICAIEKIRAMRRERKEKDK